MCFSEQLTSLCFIWQLVSYICVFFNTHGNTILLWILEMFWVLVRERIGLIHTWSLNIIHYYNFTNSLSDLSPHQFIVPKSDFCFVRPRSYQSSGGRGCATSPGPPMRYITCDWVERTGVSLHTVLFICGLLYLLIPFPPPTRAVWNLL